ncbi:NADH-quinone oxidoreductase subunit I [bacterium]|nr:NADH-quinone oxidoreductase subunit I [bacterium]
MSEKRGFFKGVWSLISGLGFTFKTIFRPTVTVRYPKEKVPVAPAFRGPVRLITDETEQHKCVACLACQRICPTNAIPVLSVAKNELNKNVPVDFVIDDALCCYCGLCVEVCPTEALEHSKVNDAVTSNPVNLRRMILQNQLITEDNDPNISLRRK